MHKNSLFYHTITNNICIQRWHSRVDFFHFQSVVLEAQRSRHVIILSYCWHVACTSSHTRSNSFYTTLNVRFELCRNASDKYSLTARNIAGKTLQEYYNTIVRYFS